MTEKGVWRTVRGRRIFIKEGQSLQDAMKESGKFDNAKKTKVRNDIDMMETAIETRIKRAKEDIEEYKNRLQEYEERIKSCEESIEKLKETIKQKKKEGKKSTEYYDSQIRTNQKNIEDFNDSKKRFEKILEESEKTINMYNNKDKVLKKAKDIMQSEGKTTSTSPYSLSTYLINEGEEITWGSKPIGSYRISDHWNFESGGETHCKLTGVNEYTEKFLIAKFNGTTYDIVEE